MNHPLTSPLLLPRSVSYTPEGRNQVPGFLMIDLSPRSKAAELTGTSIDRLKPIVPV
jgi:hypothetical protein